MAEWIYKATTAKVGLEETKQLALEYGFLCRSAYTQHLKRPQSVSRVMPDDVIHFYYRPARGAVVTIGSFRVIDGGTRFPRRFTGFVAKTALVGVREGDDGDATLVRLLEHEHTVNPARGYVRDC